MVCTAMNFVKVLPSFCVANFLHRHALQTVGEASHGGRHAHRLARSILAHDEGERLVELDDMRVVWAEAPDALDQELLSAGT